MLELSLVRLVEIVGEAAARVSTEGQGKYSTIPWAQVVGMRNRLKKGTKRALFLFLYGLWTPSDAEGLKFADYSAKARAQAITFLEM